MGWLCCGSGNTCAWCDASKNTTPDEMSNERNARGGAEPVENDNWLAWLLGR